MYKNSSNTNISGSQVENIAHEDTHYIYKYIF